MTVLRDTVVVASSRSHTLVIPLKPNDEAPSASHSSSFSSASSANGSQTSTLDTFASCLAYLANSYAQKIWLAPSAAAQHPVRQCRSSFVRMDYATALASCVRALYGAPLIEQRCGDISLHLLNMISFRRQQDDAASSNSSSYICEYDTSGLHKLHDILLFSPRSLDTYEKILFIAYQLLKLLRHLHSIGLHAAGHITLDHIYIDESFWIRVQLPIGSILDAYVSAAPTSAMVASQEEENNNANESRMKKSLYLSCVSEDNQQDDGEDGDDDLDLDLDLDELHHHHHHDQKRRTVRLGHALVWDQLELVYDSYRHLTCAELANVTKSWCDNKLSNFNYLLMVNAMAGRVLNSPFKHPIFPWISDFQSLNTNLRDLSMSKVRLNKGDAVLNMTYQASASTSPAGPYHITELVSEMSYFVYKSRVTDKDTLCKHIRHNWVPNEYPSSISRLYVWTPEECIPEFFCDASIFKSIHDDLPDLKVPEWCNGSVDEFVRTHRLLLDSDLVSKRLHNWIDLVFGYKLSGEAAIEAKNVCLSLIDTSTAMKPYGIVQLFTLPHPTKTIERLNAADEPPPKARQRRPISVADSDFYSTNPTSSSTAAQRKKSIHLPANSVAAGPDSSQIQMPDDYSPFAALERMENLLRFTHKAYNHMPSNASSSSKATSNNNNNNSNTARWAKKAAQPSVSWEELTQRDIKCFACLIAEIVLFAKVKCLPCGNDLETRCAFINRTIVKEPHIIAGPFMQLICSVLKPFDSLIQKQSSVKRGIFESTARDSNYASSSSSSSINRPQSASNSATPFVFSSSLTSTCMPIFLENMAKLQTDDCAHSAASINVHTLLSRHLSALPFKPYFGFLYAFVESFVKIDYLIANHERLSRPYVHKLLAKCIIGSREGAKKDKTALTKQQIEAMLHEQKLYLALMHMSRLMFDMSDPRANHQPQSICFTSDSFDLLLPYVLSLFENASTCVSAFLHLFSKLAKFMSRGELSARFLPLLIQVLNVVDLSDTLGISVVRVRDKLRFCKLFEFNFINELRIVFGMSTFLAHICPFLIEAISGFKDFDYSDVDVNACDGLDDDQEEEDDDNELTKKPHHTHQMPPQRHTQAQWRRDPTALPRSFLNRDDYVFDIDSSSLDQDKDKEKKKRTQQQQQPVLTNISSTAFVTFSKLIVSIGPVLICKFCCRDLLKMLAICYMNIKCLQAVSAADDAASSSPSSSLSSSSSLAATCRLIEGDRFAALILDALKLVAQHYGEQVIVLHYFTHVSNTVAACASRLTLRLESSLIGGLVLVSYFLHYLDIKVLMDTLNYVLKTIVLPVIRLYSNEQVRFPNGCAARQVLAYKLLDVMLITSVRIGAEQTRIEMRDTLRTYFAAFTTHRNFTLTNKSRGSDIVNANAALSTAANNHQQGGGGAGRASGRAAASAANVTLKKKEFVGSLSPTIKRKHLGSASPAVSAIAAAGSLTSAGSSFGAHDRNRTISVGLLRLNNEEETVDSELNMLEQAFDETSETNTPSSSAGTTPADGTMAGAAAAAASDMTSERLKQTIEMDNTFTAELASTAYLAICKCNSAASIDSMLPNAELIHRMCLFVEQQQQQQQQANKSTSNTLRQPQQQPQLISKSSRSPQLDMKRKMEMASRMSSTSYGSSFSENVGIVGGNQIQIVQDEERAPSPLVHALPAVQSSSSISISISERLHNTATPTLSRQVSSTSSTAAANLVAGFSELNLREMKATIDTTRHLSDNWLAYWENAIRETETAAAAAAGVMAPPSSSSAPLFDFKQVGLLTLTGHANAVRCMHVLDNESSIISASKDKTVKLWSLSNYGCNNNSAGKWANQTCQWTYSQHKRSVTGLLFVESLGVCASCDGSIHVWNPFIGKKIFQLDAQNVTCMANLSAPSACFVAATADNLVKMVDLRTKSFAYELRTSNSPSGPIKSLAISEHMMLAGFASGLVCAIDLRTGWKQESWKALDCDILQIKFFNSDRFACSYNDGSIWLCSLRDKIQLQTTIKIHNKPVTGMAVTDTQLISATALNKISIHSNIDKPNRMTYTFDKLKPDNFKGTVSCLSYFPLNRLLLVGSDNGDIKLIC